MQLPLYYNDLFMFVLDFKIPRAKGACVGEGRKQRKEKKKIIGTKATAALLYLASEFVKWGEEK